MTLNHSVWIFPKIILKLIKFPRTLKKPFLLHFKLGQQLPLGFSMLVFSIHSWRPESPASVDANFAASAPIGIMWVSQKELSEWFPVG